MHRDYQTPQRPPAGGHRGPPGSDPVRPWGVPADRPPPPPVHRDPCTAGNRCAGAVHDPARAQPYARTRAPARMPRGVHPLHTPGNPSGNLRSPCAWRSLLAPALPIGPAAPADPPALRTADAPGRGAERSEAGPRTGARRTRSARRRAPRGAALETVKKVRDSTPARRRKRALSTPRQTPYATPCAAPHRGEGLAAIGPAHPG